jgi:hypothetical protein
MQEPKTGLYAETDYTVYVTFEDYIKNGTIRFFSNSSTFALRTADLPEDAFVGVTLAGDKAPAGQVLEDVKSAYAKSAGVPKK